MRNALILAAMLIPALACSQNTEQDRVNNTIVAMFDGLTELSLEKIKKNSTTDLMILEHGEIWNIDTIAAWISTIRALNPVRTNSFEFIKTEIIGQTAWVAYDNKAVVTMNGQKTEKHWLESAVLIKEENEWKVKMLHSTRLSPKKD